MISEKNSSHRRALEKLKSRPDIVGIPKKKILTISIEQTLVKDGKHHTNLDLVYILKDENSETGIKAVIIEYKSNGNKGAKRKGQNQLERAVDFYQTEIGIPAEGRFITGSAYPILKRRNGHKNYNNDSTRGKK